jgi:prolyl-tRNA editing enzyme YbaK/EbsC (Cys-tRNA(Pro) deacylase)
MNILDPSVQTALDTHQIQHEAFACDPDLADTAAFCEHYGFKLDQSANTILVASRTDPVKYAACVVLADSRLDVNKKVRQLLGVKKLSFATAEQTIELTGMQIGGVVIFGLPEDIPIYIDSRVMEQEKIVMGGGNRSSKTILNPQELVKIPGVEVVEKLANLSV